MNIRYIRPKDNQENLDGYESLLFALICISLDELYYPATFINGIYFFTKNPIFTETKLNFIYLIETYEKINNTKNSILPKIKKLIKIN